MKWRGVAVCGQLFEIGAEYDAMLDKGLQLSGEEKSYFVEGRIRDLVRQLGSDWTPRRILDFGCGTGGTTRFLAQEFPGAELVGVDVASGALAHARRLHACPGIRFHQPDVLSTLPPFDLCYVNGVFHHIPPHDRADVVRLIHRSLRPGGRFALFENNPWNPGTRIVMRRIPFDRDAQLLSASQARLLLREGGFERPEVTRFLFYFPRPLAFLRFVEPRLARLPLGAQYYVLARR